jgi:hypothetical protein
MKLLGKQQYSSKEIIDAILQSNEYQHMICCDVDGFYSPYSPDGFVWYTQLSEHNIEDKQTAEHLICSAPDGTRIEFTDHENRIRAIVKSILVYKKMKNVWIPDESNKDCFIDFNINVSDQSDFSDDIPF